MKVVNIREGINYKQLIAQNKSRKREERIKYIRNIVAGLRSNTIYCLSGRGLWHFVQDGDLTYAEAGIEPDEFLDLMLQRAKEHISKLGPKYYAYGIWLLNDLRSQHMQTKVPRMAIDRSIAVPVHAVS